MKIKHLIILLLFTVFTGFSQDDVKLIKSSHDLYEANYLMDFEAIAALSYPKMVAQTGREVFLEQTELHYENETYRLRYQLQSVPLKTSGIKTINGRLFCVTKIHLPLRYFFEAKLTPEQAAQKKAWLQQINDTQEVTFEPNRNSFNVKKIVTYVAVADETTNGEWRYFNFDSPQQLAAFNALFDENVKTALGLKK